MSRKKTIVNRRSSEYNAKLFGFAELGRDSTMSESKLSPLCSLLPRLSIVEREGGKPKVNRRSSECRALISSCLGKRPEVERRVDSSSTSEAASRLLGRAKRPLGDEGDACYRRDARKPSGEFRDSFKVDSRNTMEELRNIFASSCVEAAARKLGCSTSEMYRRMKRVGLIHGFIIPGYEALHSQSRELTNE